MRQVPPARQKLFGAPFEKVFCHQPHGVTFESMKRFVMVMVLLLLVGAAVLKLVVFELPRVAGNDMAPTLQPGDLLLANRLDTTPERGELVLLEHPRISGRLLLRRVVGLPGERVEVRKEVPVVDGKPALRREVQQVTLRDGDRRLTMKLVEETVARAPTCPVLKDPGRRSRDPAAVTLGSSQYYVLADNRNHGTDSRTFGPVPGERIRAVVTRRISAGPGSIDGQSERAGWTRLSK